MNNSIPVCVRTIILLALTVIVPAFAFSQTPTTQDRVAAFKSSLTQSQAALRKYQWIETTTVSLKGEVKSVKQNTCYYGADGKVVKVPIAEPPAQAQAPSGGRGGRLKQKIVENKKEEMSDYMKQAVELVHQYVPPNPDLIKYSKETNNIKAEPVDQAGGVRLTIPNFIKNGDSMSAVLNSAKNTIVNVNVSSYLDSPKDVITVAVAFTQLADGTNYAGKTTLNAPAKNIVVVVENNGHKPL